MAENIMMRRQVEAPLLLVVRVEKQQQQQQARAFPPLPAVVLVSQWGLLSAAAVAFDYIFVSVLIAINLCLPSWMLPPPGEPRDAALDARATALLLGYFWCTVPQAAAGTLALVLAPRRRRVRRALAWAVLAAAVASHCMYAGAVGIRNVNRPGYSAFIRINWALTIFVYAVGDLYCLLALLVGSDE